MSIKLISGKPGAGKTLSLVAALVELRKARGGESRPVYAYGIAGLKDGLALPCDPKVLPVRNPNFGGVDEPEFLPWWAQLPHGSIVCIDEVQDVWPTNRLTGEDLRGRNLDIFMLTRHRHWGYDFLLTTQKPAFLHKHVRDLVDEHTHIVRRWNRSKVDRYVWQEGQEDVQNRTVRSLAQRQSWKYPRECFDLYRSSTVHTMKRRLPWQYWLMIGAGLLAVPMIWFAVHRVLALRHISQDAGTAPAVSGRVPGVVSGAVFGEEKRRWATPADYVRDHLPRVANQPWSAPVFDQVPVKAQPDLLCIEYHRVIKGVDQELCSCFTEQVTPYELHSLVECRRYARDGVYNPRRAPISAARYAADSLDSRGPRGRSEAGTAAQAAGPADATAWQPAWRTRPYVQPERTSAVDSNRAVPAGG